MSMIIAHRGASADVPFGNTMAAFEKAHEVGAPMIELDLRQTQDKQWVCFHDADFQGSLISEMTYEELQFRTSPVTLEVPLFEDVLKWSKGRIQLDIELKECGYEPKIARLVEQYLLPKDCVFTSFNDDSIRIIKQLFPEFQCGLLVGKEAPQSPQTRMQELFPGNRLNHCRADFIAPHYQLLTLGFVERMKNAQIPVYVWTVNEPLYMERFIQMGLAGIITDHPKMALQILES